MQKLWKKALLWFMQTKVYSDLVLKIIPFIRLSTYYTSMRGNQYHEGYKFLKPGVMLLTLDSKKLTTFLVPGDFTHAALCVGDCRSGDGFEIVEMTHHNFTHSTFFDLCKESDRVVIVECPDWDEEYVKKVVAKALTFEGAVYDVEFGLGVKALYCSELIYQADVEKRLRVDLADLADLGRPYISPDGLYKAENLAILWDSKNTVPQY